MEIPDEDYCLCPKCGQRMEIEARYVFDDVVAKCAACARKWELREINGGKRHSRGGITVPGPTDTS